MVYRDDGQVDNCPIMLETNMILHHFGMAWCRDVDDLDLVQSGHNKILAIDATSDL